MKARPLAAVVEAAAKRERQKVWAWCRLHNDFLNHAKFRLAAENLRLPLHQVQAFAVGLEIFSNVAGNIGYDRAYVGHFEASEFGVAHGMSAEDAARIYAELENVGWHQDGYIVTFLDRNRDQDYDENAKLRKRRERNRKYIRDALVSLARRGLIEQAYRTDIEVRLLDLDDAGLHRLLATLQHALSTGRTVTRDTRDTVDKSDAAEKTPSDQRAESFPRSRVTAVTSRDSHVEQSTFFSEAAVDNSGAAARAAGGASGDDGATLFDTPQATAEAWLLSEGLRIVTQRTDESPTLAALWMERWLHQRLGGNAVALQEVIESVRATDTTVARFLNLIDDGIKRVQQRPQPSLPLMPPRPGRRRTGTDDA